MEEEIRQKAITRYRKGENPKSIYKNLSRSKVWFFQWLKRYHSGDPEWFKDKSRAPIRRPCQISEIDKQRIISVRQNLELQKFSQTGASAIKWELVKSGHSFPSDSTINRVLKREGLIEKPYTSPKESIIHIS